ncbi:MAG: DNA polymerase III subunit gamma/tau [Bacteroidia bacterium]
MEPYLVSFRRHRPDSFLSVVGQTHITQTLKNAIRTDKLAQAMLFCGPRGVGKTTCARILAKAINCLQPTDEAEACGTCKSCASIRDGGSLAIYELDAASNNSVDDIRNLVEQVRYPPQGGKFKVYIIDEVHMLSTAAFNAFLKTLEEPPHYAIFILATTEKHKILPTILSRCQVYQFNRIRIPDIAGELERVCRADNIPFEEQALYSLAEKADGALRDALSMLDQIVGFSGGQIRLEDVVKNLNLLDSRLFFDATNAILDGDLSSLLLLLQKIVVDGFETDAFLAGLASHWRWLLLARDERTRGMLEVGKDSLPLYIKQAEQLSLDVQLSGLNLLAQAEINHRQSRNPRLHAEMVLAKLCYARQLLLPPDTDIPESSQPISSQAAPEVSPKPESIETSNSGGPVVAKPIKISKIKSPALQSSIAISDNPKTGSEHYEHQKENAELFTLEVAWHKLLEGLLKQGRKYAYAALSQIKPVLNNASEIDIPIEHDAQRTALDDLIFDLTNQLRRWTGQSDLQLKLITVAPHTQSATFATLSEKKQWILDKYPHINPFIQKLGLDWSY